jgi:hypothetical protein
MRDEFDIRKKVAMARVLKWPQGVAENALLMDAYIDFVAWRDQLVYAKVTNLPFSHILEVMGKMGESLQRLRAVMSYAVPFRSDDEVADKIYEAMLEYLSKV